MNTIQWGHINLVPLYSGKRHVSLTPTILSTCARTGSSSGSVRIEGAQCWSASPRRSSSNSDFLEIHCRVLFSFLYVFNEFQTFKVEVF